MNMYVDEVRLLVSRLPEIYQPIYGHPELSKDASRATEDRFEDIKRVYELLSGRLGRPLRVLDLGCAQGFVSLSLAALGASVVGVEMLPENVELCRKLGSLNPQLDVNFVEARLEEFVPSLDGDHFDLVLLLSVIHHVAFHISPEVAEEIVVHLRSIAPVLLTELAVAEEPLYWASALPLDPVSILGDALFVRELRRTATHLSDVNRPLFFVSDAYWYVANELDAIKHVRHGGHRFAKRSFQDSRTYLLSDDRVLKVLSTQGDDGEVNRRELDGEVAFLRAVESEGTYPKIIGVDEDSRNLFLLREKIDGQLLIDAIDEGHSFDFFLIVRDLLRECIELERRGLYHSDIRVWNVLAREHGKFSLIDYGAISPSKSDCFWPQNIYIAFLVFVKELLSAPEILVGSIREIAVSPYGFPGAWSAWVADLSGYPLPQWDFALMLQRLEAAFKSPEAPVVGPATTQEALLKMLEEAVTVIARSESETVSDVEADRKRINQMVRSESERISNLHNDLLGLEREQQRMDDALVAHAPALSLLQQAAEVQRAQSAELMDKVDYTCSKLDELRGLAGAGKADSQALRASLDRLTGQLQSIEQGLSEFDRRLAALEINADRNFTRILSAHDGLAQEVSTIKTRVFQKGFWGRLLSR